MLTLTSPHLLPRLTGSCVTIGNFDGVHLGHQALIGTVTEKARRLGVPAIVVTFWPHPLQVLAGNHAPPLLTDQAERQRLLRSLDTDITLELPFNRQLAALSPEEFVRAVLLPLRCRELVIGYDFSLGKGRAGNADVLAALGRKYGFGVEQLSPVIVNDAVVSSSRMRDLMRAGEMWELQALTGRFHTISGRVVHGYGRGGGLGYPTANVGVGDTMLPRIGVYATWIGTQRHIWPSVTNIGVNPTFGNDKISVESFLLNTTVDLYDQDVTLHFVQRLRDEQRFASPEELKARIARDVELARGILEDSYMPVRKADMHQERPNASRMPATE